jgi:DNA helicase-2/ATP-dependent DNA helicase PcrA
VPDRPDVQPFDESNVVERETTVADLLDDLDQHQRRAVTSDAPLLAIIAGAGSGKTRVLTRRVAHQCLTGSAEPSHVAVLTFTRQAASELHRRLRALGTGDGLIAGTFHSVALSMLRQYWDQQGRSHPTVVSDRRRLIGEVIGPKHGTSIAALSSDIDWARARNVEAARYSTAVANAGRRSLSPAADVARVMADLEKLKAKRGVIDLDDLLSTTIHLMRNDEKFASIARWRMRHLFVDEAQDLNPLQLEVLELWRGDRDQLTLVGDPSQSIYGFNGSDPTILTNLESRFPGIEVVRLGTNYRCTPQVVAAGLNALTNGGASVPDLVSARPNGSAIRIHGFADEHLEATGIADIIDEIGRERGSWRSTAVLARTNAQLPPIRAALEARGVPARILGAAAADPVQRATREVGDLPSASRIATWSRDARDPSDDDATEDITARRTVADAVDEFLRGGGGDGRAFLAWVRANRPFDVVTDSNVVELLTFHGAKGREWDHVVVAGCEVGLMPHSSAKSDLERAEEIRLAYVAITRASDDLILTHAHRRRDRARTRSPFIDGADAVEPGVAPPAQFRRDNERRRSSAESHDSVLLELREWRNAAGRAAQVDATMLCSDATLKRIAQRAPRTLDDLTSIDGVGPLLARRAGERILEAVSRGVARRTDHADG